MDAQVSVRRIEKFFQVAEAHLLVRRKRADNTEPHALVYYLVELTRDISGSFFEA